MLNVSDKITVEIKRLGINGEGIGYYNRLAIFIPGAIPGERCDVEITSVSEKMAYAKVLDIKNASRDRCEPKCKYYSRCGGCNTMHINYEKMGEYKRDRVIESITRYTDLNPRSFEIKKTVLMKSPYGYRFKASLPVRKFNDNATVGLYSVDGKEVIYIDGCMNQADQINNINKKILALMDKLNVVPYIEKYKRGEVKYIVTRVSHFNKEAQVTFVIGEKTPKILELAKEVIKIEGVVSVFESFADGEGDSLIFGSDIKLLEGKKTILESIGKYKFELLPTAFFQLNPIQTEVLYEHVLKACKLSFKERVLDAYCGVGTIGIYLAHNSSEVVGIEYNKEAVENANNNAKLNKI
ncbi:MAG: 23S rRNA (uracil(1939)-C(5))-methyltransferase RlmD, partial [Acholeplasmatales bacterium]|nr:23S rRNA (uracil(1939)-C(5))-methyltransferase RlmD [Acholeplasmatales bacterium]